VFGILAVLYFFRSRTKGFGSSDLDASSSKLKKALEEFNFVDRDI
jgi:hypothetical protein